MILKWEQNWFNRQFKLVEVGIIPTITLWISKRPELETVIPDHLKKIYGPTYDKKKYVIVSNNFSDAIKYIKAMKTGDDKTTGILSGFPKCCINAWCNNTYKKYDEQKKLQTFKMKIGYMRCDNCLVSKKSPSYKLNQKILKIWKTI